MNNTFTKDDYRKAAVLMRGLILDKISDDIYISDLLENAITNIEIIERLLVNDAKTVGKN